MKLSNIPLEMKAIIKKIECNNELKQRFYSFGIIKGATIFIENISFSKNTIEINVDDTSIGIRVEEADTINVEVL